MLSPCKQLEIGKNISNVCSKTLGNTQCKTQRRETGLVGSVITPLEAFSRSQPKEGSLNGVPDFSDWENRNQKPKEREVNRNNLQKHPQESLAEY